MSAFGSGLMGFDKQVPYLFRPKRAVVPLPQGNALVVTHKSRVDPIHLAWMVDQIGG
jgi:hypothetical protein